MAATALSQVKSSKKNNKRKTIIYGPHGVGKSTWASQWPCPIAIDTEDGISDLDIPCFPLCTDATDLWRYVDELQRGEHKYQTLVIDSLDWAESLIARKICDQHGKPSITDFDYGRGPGLVTSMFCDWLDVLSKLCRSRAMHIVCVAHSSLTKIERPDATISREGPKLLVPVSALVQEWADEVLFATQMTFVSEKNEGFNKTRTVVTGGEVRALFTEARAAFSAKNRLGLPPEMPLDCAEYLEYLVDASTPSTPSKKEETK